MIKSVRVINYLGESIKLELGVPEKSGFLIQSITGLGAGKADINSTDLSTADGSVYNSSRVLSRNIVFSLIFQENPTIEATRQMSYKYFPIKKRVQLIFETDNRISEIYGYVESNDPNIFSKKEGTQISIICPDPYFYSTKENVTLFSGIEPAFEFPLSNESFTENLIIMGEITFQQEKSVYYDGDAEVGIIIYIHALGDVSGLSIYNLITQEIMSIDSDKLLTLTGSDITQGDAIIISTIKGKKSIQLLREGVYINILNCLSRDVDWFKLAKGDNIFAFTADTGSSHLQFRVENKKVYEGV